MSLYVLVEQEMKKSHRILWAENHSS